MSSQRPPDRPAEVLQPSVLYFGRMYEDSAVELSALDAALVPTEAPVFCIASAGCMALALAKRGHHVTTVDVNAAQIEYLQERLLGAPPRDGYIDRLLSLGRRRLCLRGADQQALLDFLSLSDGTAQLDMWQHHPQAALWRESVGNVLLSFWHRAGAARGEESGADVLHMLLQRVERGLAIHPNRSNRYLWRLLNGSEPPIASSSHLSQGAEDDRAERARIRALVADAVDFLEEAPPQSFAAFTISNLDDVLPRKSMLRLRSAILRAACPGAIWLRRSILPAFSKEEAAWASMDRSFLWGRIAVVRAQQDEAPILVPHMSGQRHYPDKAY